MFRSNQSYVGTQYTGTVAFSVLAIAVPLAALLLFRPMGLVSDLLVAGFSAACASLAWMHWRWNSELTIPSITRGGGGSHTAIPLILTSLLTAPMLSAADLSTYRGFKFGADLATAASQAGQMPGSATLIQGRPAEIHEMGWMKPISLVADPGSVDPVRSGKLYFLDGQLYRIVITYDPFRIEGLTEEDIIDGVSKTYGKAERPGVEIAFHSVYSESAKVVARWQDNQYAYDLIRAGDQSGFVLILYSKREDALAQRAMLEAARLDRLEAPQRRLDEEKKRAAEGQKALENSRALNKPNFLP
jgi:hypothetical protein